MPDAIEIKVTIRPDQKLRAERAMELTPKGFPHELTLEEWRLPDGEELVEVSINTPGENAPQAMNDFDAHLRELGLDPEGAQETKTRTALRHLAKAQAGGRQ